MWTDEAACTPADSDLFFSDEVGRPSKSKQERAKAICARCPVSAKCLAFAITEQIEFGIYGGLTPEERGLVSA